MRSLGLFREYYFLFHKGVGCGYWSRCLYTVFHCSSLPLLLKGLSPVGDSRCQGCTKTLATSLLRSYTMSTPSSGSADNGAGGKRSDIQGDLGSMSEIQQQLAVLSMHLSFYIPQFEKAAWPLYFCILAENTERVRFGDDNNFLPTPISGPLRFTS